MLAITGLSPGLRPLISLALPSYRPAGHSAFRSASLSPVRSLAVSNLCSFLIPVDIQP